MTLIRKDIRGNWKAESKFNLPNGRSLEISTHKVSSGQLITSAIVGKDEGAFFSYVMYQDLSERMVYSAPTKCTGKKVEEQHNHALTLVEDLKTKIAAFYASKEVETV